MKTIPEIVKHRRAKYRRGPRDSFATYDNPHNIDFATYRLILKSYNYLLARNIMETGEVRRLPSLCGLLSIRKTATKKQGAFDYNLFKKEGIKRYIQNDHSSGLIAFLKWDKSYGSLRVPPHKKKLFHLSFQRTRKRELAQLIMHKNYINKYYDN